jgi:hypothetical protein
MNWSAMRPRWMRGMRGIRDRQLIVFDGLQAIRQTHCNGLLFQGISSGLPVIMLGVFAETCTLAERQGLCQ